VRKRLAKSRYAAQYTKNKNMAESLADLIAGTASNSYLLGKHIPLPRYAKNNDPEKENRIKVMQDVDHA
jgi:hypothetical protein